MLAFSSLSIFLLAAALEKFFLFFPLFLGSFCSSFLFKLCLDRKLITRSCYMSDLQPIPSPPSVCSNKKQYTICMIMLLYFFFDQPFSLNGFFFGCSGSASTVSCCGDSCSSVFSSSGAATSSSLSSSSKFNIELNSVLNLIPSLARSLSVSPIRSSSFLRLSDILASSASISAFISFSADRSYSAAFSVL